jgi:beta-phosphoglucomutase
VTPAAASSRTSSSRRMPSLLNRLGTPQILTTEFGRMLKTYGDRADASGVRGKDSTSRYVTERSVSASAPATTTPARRPATSAMTPNTVLFMRPAAYHRRERRSAEYNDWRMSKIAAVIFDLDGVLIDATEWHYEALNRALGLFGFAITRYEHLTVYNGLPTRKKLEMLSVEKGLPRSLHDLIARAKQAYTRDEIQTKCRPTFEKEYMLSRLRREGYRLAVCSNAVRESVELMLRHAGALDYFEFVMGNEDARASKPDPAPYLVAMERLGVRPDATVVVEDSAYGVEAARRAGAWICQVAGPAEVDYRRVRAAIDTAEREG